MAKFKGIKWTQILTLMAAIAQTLVDNYVTKDEFSVYENPYFNGDVLVFPTTNAAHFDGDTLVLTQ